jgi:hypothetical protein
MNKYNKKYKWFLNGFKVQGSRFKVQGSRFKVQGYETLNLEHGTWNT